ncbi:glutamine-fructose-6-phosphate transaminase [Aureococcus anophagefferens]|uniref:Glutamine-fructose-6-phosphate transaminase n=1 Tax=Aureococcus anophagefferens TaxID=44056 RepID=A0ABR1GCG5_AURAN
MCRWLVYCSAEPIVLADLVLNSHHSIVRQSFSGGFHPDCSDKNNMRMNADGFGLGWYGLRESGASAAIFRSITPAWSCAWSNRNLRELAGVVSSRCCFAHVRAATPGSVVSEENTHPFRYGRLLFQHNGHIEGFARVKRRLIEKLPDGLLAWVDGSTDSEYCFALLLAQLERPGRADRFPVAELEFAVLRTLAILKALGDDERIVDGFSTCNFALADGASVVITRYCDKAPQIPPPSLYYTFRCSNELKAALVSGADDARAAGLRRRGRARRRRRRAARRRRRAGAGRRRGARAAGGVRRAAPAFMCASSPWTPGEHWARFVEENTIISFAARAGGYCALALSGLDPNLGDGSSCSSISPVDPHVFVVNDLGLFLFRMEGAKDIMESYAAQGLEPYAAAVAAWADLAPSAPGEDAAETAPINGNDARCTKVRGATNGVKTVPGARAVRVAPRDNAAQSRYTHMAEPTKRARRASAAAMPPPPPRPATSAGGGAPAWSKADWERWSRAPRMATLEVGEGCALLLMKAPLGERYEDRYGGEAYLHDARDWDDWDVKHVKLGARRGPADRLVDAAPTRIEVDEAVAAAEAWKRPSVAAVYSLDGCNTPGLVAVAALVELRGAPVNAAFNAVAEHRPLFRQKHVAWLKARYPALAAAPAPRPAWLGGGDDGDDASDGEEPLAAAAAPAPAAARADADARRPA